MTRKKFLLSAVCLLLAIATVIGTVVWALLQSPHFYEVAIREQADPVVRKKAAKRFVQRTLRLVDEIKTADHWSEEFTEQQINAWLAEELHQKFAEWVPPGVSDPRVKLTKQSIHLGFRYKDAKWNGVVSLRLKPWVTEPNQLAIQVESIRAGLVPIPLEDVLQEVAKRFKKNDKDQVLIEWKQLDGKDVAIVRLAKEQPEQPVLEAVDVKKGAVRISGSRMPPGESFRFELPRVAERIRIVNQSAAE